MKKTHRPAWTLEPDEQFLLKRLPDALLLEKSMGSIRQKYFGLWETICKYVYPEPDYRSVEKPDDDGPAFAIVKDTWTPLPEYWPSGFYVGGIGFENLCHGQGAPYAYIWIRLPKSVGIGYLDNARKRLREEATRAFGRELREEPHPSVIMLN